MFNLAPVRAGFLSNHLADLVVPAWLYLLARSVYPGAKPNTLIAPTVGHTPARGALVLFTASTITERWQRVWPQGLFRGRFDRYDIGAYAVGLAAIFLVEKCVRIPSANIADADLGSRTA